MLIEGNKAAGLDGLSEWMSPDFVHIPAGPLVFIANASARPGVHHVEVVQHCYVNEIIPIFMHLLCKLNPTHQLDPRNSDRKLMSHNFYPDMNFHCPKILIFRPLFIINVRSMSK